MRVKELRKKLEEIDELHGNLEIKSEIWTTLPNGKSKPFDVTPDGLSKQGEDVWMNLEEISEVEE